jgi:hypothetical protein
MMLVPHSKHLWASTPCYGDSFTLLYVDDVRTSQETRIWASTPYYGDSFTLLYVDDVRTSQETRQWARTASYGDNFTSLLSIKHLKVLLTSGSPAADPKSGPDYSDFICK